MMRELLRCRVGKPAGFGASDNCLGLIPRGESNLERDFVEHRTRFTRIRQKEPITGRSRYTERFPRSPGHDPRADPGRRRLGLERPEWLGFPSSDIARRPVVEQQIAENIVVSLLNRQHARRGLPHNRAEFEVKARRGGEMWQRRLQGLDLAPGAGHVGSRHDD